MFHLPSSLPLPASLPPEFSQLQSGVSWDIKYITTTLESKRKLASNQKIYDSVTSNTTKRQTGQGYFNNGKMIRFEKDREILYDRVTSNSTKRRGSSVMAIRKKKKKDSKYGKANNICHRNNQLTDDPLVL